MLPVSLILDFCATFLFQTGPNAENLYFMQVPKFVVMNTRTQAERLHAIRAPHNMGSRFVYACV
jgi:hypothetical protein